MDYPEMMNLLVMLTTLNTAEIAHLRGASKADAMARAADTFDMLTTSMSGPEKAEARATILQRIDQAIS